MVTGQTVLPRLCVGCLTVAFSAPLLWAGLWITGALGWIGLGLVIVSLPIGPALGVLATRRVMSSASAFQVVPFVVSMSVAILATLSIAVFGPHIASGLSYAPLLVGAAIVGALVAPIRAEQGESPRRSLDGPA
jgi:hypothetical protein